MAVHVVTYDFPGHISFTIEGSLWAVVIDIYSFHILKKQEECLPFVIPNVVFYNFGDKLIGISNIGRNLFTARLKKEQKWKPCWTLIQN